VFDWLRRAFVPVRRNDPRFGAILFMRAPKGRSYWEGSGVFAGAEVEYFVTAGEDGPTDAQRALADAIERRWGTLEPRLAEVLGRHERVARASRMTARLEDYALGSLAIPAEGGTDEDLEITFLFKDGGDLLTFELDPRGETPRAVRFET
jgi:hypothetical protein